MMNELVNKIIKFRDSRGWDETDTPENMVKSLVIEASELLENFQWGEISYNQKNVEEELADITILLLALVHDLNLDLEQIVDLKLKKIAKKYPVKN